MKIDTYWRVESMHVKELNTKHIEFLKDLIRFQGGGACDSSRCELCPLCIIDAIQYPCKIEGGNDTCSHGSAYRQAVIILAAYEQYIDDTLLGVDNEDK